MYQVFFFSKIAAIHSFKQEKPNTYYVGVGQFNGWPDQYTRVYGSYWNASIRNLGNNTNANGTVSQKVTTLKKGWYKVHVMASLVLVLEAYEGKSVC